jgi:hypothetical protein
MKEVYKRENGRVKLVYARGMWTKLNKVTREDVERRLDQYPVGLDGEPLGWEHGLTEDELKDYVVYGALKEDEGMVEMTRGLRSIGGLDGAARPCAPASTIRFESRANIQVSLIS